MKYIAGLLLLAFSNNVFAECKPVTYISSGQISECTGYIFSSEKELEVRQMKEDYQLLKQEIEIYSRQKALYEQTIYYSQEMLKKQEEETQLWKEHSDVMTKKYVESERRMSYRDWAFVFLGVGITVLGGYAAGQAGK